MELTVKFVNKVFLAGWRNVCHSMQALVPKDKQDRQQWKGMFDVYTGNVMQTV